MYGWPGCLVATGGDSLAVPGQEVIWAQTVEPCTELEQEGEGMGGGQCQRLYERHIFLHLIQTCLGHLSMSVHIGSPHSSKQK